MRGRVAGSGNAVLKLNTVAFGAVVFAAIGLVSIGLGMITPDFGVLLAVLASAACCFQLERCPGSWSWAVALGVVLGARLLDQGHPAAAGCLSARPAGSFSAAQ